MHLCDIIYMHSFKGRIIIFGFIVHDQLLADEIKTIRFGLIGVSYHLLFLVRIEIIYFTNSSLMSGIV